MQITPTQQSTVRHVDKIRHGFLISNLGWFALAIIAIAVLLPVIPLVFSWLTVDAGLWSHLWQTQLSGLLANTLILSVFVGIGAFVLGVSLAWLVVIYEFPGRKILQWCLMLPIAIPPYILAFVLLGFTDFGGALEQIFKSVGLSSSYLPDIRNSLGVSLVFILSLYPYVYLLTRASLLKKGQASYESARTLGYSKQAAFWKLIIPMTRPAWMAGLALVLMETLADFGAVSIFNYDTFTTAIYKSWFGLFSLETAAQLASILLLLVFLALLSERFSRGAASYQENGQEFSKFRKPLSGIKGTLVQLAAWLVSLIAFILPLIQLIYWSLTTSGYGQTIINLLSNTIQLAFVATAITLVVAMLLVFAQRFIKNQKAKQYDGSLLTEVSLSGYALPGTVLAVGVVISFNAFESWLGLEQWLTGGIFALLFAYAVRFMRIAHGPVDNAMGQIKPSIIEASMSLGANSKERLWRVYIPLLRPGVLTAMLMVFVEVMKEMPATLLLRPFGWDTLSVRIYELTSEGEWQLAALPAVLLVMVGIIPVIYLIKKSEN
ncbi:iron ABC transporter permease [Kangiella sp. HZ709]|uniref:ABC transporter permease n=1 Tax=Kangiella sp. HZ709 TaxID=2666328 RepID=UPI0012B005EC|nr:iron ABC transporter permease [Kangiella sp. HZ709]MRX28079.1 ABC transporter permease subunit [Kangiella sp. HZ709]